MLPTTYYCLLRLYVVFGNKTIKTCLWLTSRQSQTNLETLSDWLAGVFIKVQRTDIGLTLRTESLI